MSWKLGILFLVFLYTTARYTLSWRGWKRKRTGELLVYPENLCTLQPREDYSRAREFRWLRLRWFRVIGGIILSKDVWIRGRIGELRFVIYCWDSLRMCVCVCGKFGKEKSKNEGEDYDMFYMWVYMSVKERWMEDASIIRVEWDDKGLKGRFRVEEKKESRRLKEICDNKGHQVWESLFKKRLRGWRNEPWQWTILQSCVSSRERRREKKIEEKKEDGDAEVFKEKERENGREEDDEEEGRWGGRKEIRDGA